MYLTYAEYLNMGGQEIGETAFNNFEFEARAQIDYWTFNRLQKEETQPEAVKRCMYSIIKRLLEDEEVLQASIPTATGETVRKRGSIMSESNDGVSVSYNTISAAHILENSLSDIHKTVEKYLGNIRNSLGKNVLYRGIYPDE